MQIDASEFDALAKDLGAAPPLVKREVRGVVTKGAVNVKNQLRSEMSASTHFKGVSRGITFDIETDGTAVEALIGPEKGAPGSLANIAYFGGTGWGDQHSGGTVADPMGALEAEAPNFEKALLDLVEKALGG